MDIQPKRLTAAEYQSLLYLSGALSELEHHAGPMEIRAKLTPNGYKLLKSARGMLRKALDEVIHTIPRDKLLSIQRDLKHTATITRVTYSDTKQEDSYRWVNAEAIDVLAAYTAEYTCGMCDKTGPEISKCEVRKYINQCYPFDIAVPKNGVCSMSGCFDTKEFCDLTMGKVESDQEENNDAE